MQEFKGVAIYEILPNGCLNGIWTDENPIYNKKIYNEIARKKSDQSTDTLQGEYVCSFTEFNDQVVVCQLEIKEIVKDVYYRFIWKWGEIELEGEGWRASQNQVSVTYQYSPSLFERYFDKD